MKTVTLEFTNNEARCITLYLREKYSKDLRTTLKRLCNIAVKMEVAAQAKKELDEAEEELNRE